jgi:hypothetical protein
MQKSLLKRLQRVRGIGHSVVRPALRKTFNTKSSSRDSSDRVPVSRRILLPFGTSAAPSKRLPQHPAGRLLLREAVYLQGVVQSLGRSGVEQ